jgi:hypothetical protein
VSKKIAVYGIYVAKVPTIVHQRYWKTRSDGVKQRYWKKVIRPVRKKQSGRYEFSGSGKTLYKAVVKGHKLVPKKFVDVEAKTFLEHPEEYGQEGYWSEREIESR